MRIREYTAADIDELRRLHAAQGFGYPLPDLDSPLFVSKLVLEDDAEDISAAAFGRMSDAGTCADTRSSPEKPKIAMAVLLRLTAEAYLLHDPRLPARRIRDGKLFSRCTMQRAPAPPREVSMMYRLFCRREWRARLDDASRASAGRATRGIVSRSACEFVIGDW